MREQTMRNLLRSMRPEQWLKNLVVFAALIFSFNIFQADLVLRAIGAFVAFCAIASGVYLVNDVLDVSRDRQHPIKSLRPIAAEKLSFATAGRWSALFLAVGLGGGFWLDWRFGFVLVMYLALQILYSYWLKRVVILDVMIVAAGFVLRAIGGAFAIDVIISHWLLITTLLLSLFLGFGKRRHEIALLNERANAHRGVLNEYNLLFLDQMIGIVTAATLIMYILYTTSDEAVTRFGDTRLILTMPLVLYGIFRYLYLIHKKERGGDPSKTLLTDPPLLVAIGLWVATVIGLIYYVRA